MYTILKVDHGLEFHHIVYSPEFLAVIFISLVSGLAHFRLKVNLRAEFYCIRYSPQCLAHVLTN